MIIDGGGNVTRSQTRTAALPRDLPSITGLRYLAAALVLFHHAALVFTPGSIVEQLTATGYVGVTFFFLLSGFVLTWSMSPGVPKRAFYRNRFARIYPLYFATWAAAVSVSFLIGTEKSIVGVVLSMILLQAWVPDPMVYLGGNAPGWSLSVEALFYAVFPFLVGARIRLHERRGWLLVGAAVVVTGGILYSLSPAYSHWFAYYSPIYNITSFLLGIGLAAAVKRGSRCPLPIWAAVAVAAAAYLALGLFAPDAPRGFSSAIMVAPGLLIIWAAATSDIEGRRSMWASRPLVALGQWSFALYLIHFMMIRVAERILPAGMTENVLLGSLAMAALLVVASAASGLAYALIEKPGREWLRSRRPPAREPSSLASDPM